MRSRRWWKRLSYGLVGVAIAFIFVACNPNKPATPDASQLPNAAPLSNPFPTVEALPAPALPAWIEQISPKGEADELVQIRIRFQAPLIPLGALESSGQQAVLEKFELVPKLPGKFRFLTPRMVGFQGDRALPKATRLQVTLKAGLSDLENHQLDQDLAWTFNTSPIELTELPGLPDGSDLVLEPMDLEPSLEFTANTALNLKSLEEHVRLVPKKEGARAIAIKAEPVEETDDWRSQSGEPSPTEKFNPSDRPKRYRITPKRSLKKATNYRLSFTSGIRPKQGNLTSEEQYDRQLVTYGPLTFSGVETFGEPGYGGAYDRFTNGLGTLKFNNGLMAESALKNISVEPPPKDSPQLLKAYNNEPEISLNPWALEPNTEYTFTLGADLTDQYGQTLGKTETVTYKTGDLSPNVWAPSGLNIFPTNQKLQLNVSTVNLPESYRAAFATVRPTDLIYTDSAYPHEGNSLLPDESQWPALTIKNEKNKVEENAIPLAEKLPGRTGMLAYGVQARTVQVEGEWRQPSYYGLVQLTNLGVFAQWFPESGLVQVHHLSDGAPVVVAVDIYRSQLESTPRSNPSPCATGVTDETGILRLTADALKQCMPQGTRFDEPPELLAIAREQTADGEDWAFVRTRPWSGSYGYGIYTDWESSKPLSRGTIFSDRQLYQPGEVAWFTGIADYLKGGVLMQDKNVVYSIALEDPEGNKTELGKQTTNEFGTFSTSWTVGEKQTVGNYFITAKSEAGIEIQGNFRIAEFKPPNFKVDLSLDKEIATSGDRLSATTQSNYLFGSPVQDAAVAYYVTRTPVNFVPKGWKQFSFGRRWDWPEERPVVETDVLQKSETLSAAGSSELSIPVKGELPYPLEYRIDAEVSDVSNLSVSGAQTFTALPSDKLIGLQADFVATAGEAFPIKVIVSDAAGKAIAGQQIRVELQKATYSRVTEVIEGSRIPINQVQYETVADTTVRSGKTAKTVQLTPPESGSYRLRANFANAKTPGSATDLRLWATGDTPVYWGSRYKNNRVTVQLDKDSYDIGETATALIQSPYPEADLYFAVIRHDTLYQTLTRVEGGAPQVQFTVTPEMLPNAAVQAVLVRRGEPLEEMEELGALEDLSSVGFAAFKTSLENKYLTVTIEPEQDKLLPGEEETLRLTLTDNDNQPATGQFTVMVVNDAVLQLSGYRPPDLVETVYAEQPVSTRFADNRESVAIAPLSSPLAKGWGYGGGLSSGAASTRLRENFQALAYYEGAVLTNENGEAQVSFDLPDDLTTWRVMAVATDGNLHFGNGEATFMTTQPLITNPLLPQFMRQGDRLEIGLSAINTTEQRGRLSFSGGLSEGLQFVDSESASTLDEQVRAQKGTAAYRFTVLAERPGTETVEFRSQLGNVSDAFKVPITVQALEVTEQVVEAGTTADSVSIPIRVAEEANPQTGGLEIALASNLLSNLQMPAQQAFSEQYFPCLETLASRLAIASQLKILSEKYPSSVGDINLEEEATSALTQIQDLQQPEGGFASWPGSKRADPFVTPYAVSAIAQAKAAGFAVNDSLLTQSKTYLNSMLTDPGQYDYCQSPDCKNKVRLETLTALADIGDVRNQYLSWLYDQRETFGLVDQIKLARQLSRFSEWENESVTLADQIQESLYKTGRSATVNLPNNFFRRWHWLNSQTAAQSQALRLFIARNSSPEVLARLVQGLLSQRREGTWRNSYNNAQVLTALVDYTQRLPAPPNFETTVQLAGKTLASESFQGYEAASTKVNVPIAELPRGESFLQLQKQGEGELHYVSAYRYRPQGNPPGRLNGLRITRELRQANQPEVLHRFGLKANEEAIALAAGQVFDIGLEIISDRPVEHVIITDPLPAGLEAVDTTFQTATGALQAQQDSWEIDYQRIYRDRIVAYADRLDAGVYQLHYLVRTVTPGTFGWPGATAQLQYAPEEFGRTAAATLQVESK